MRTERCGGCRSKRGEHAHACGILRFATFCALQGKKSGGCSHVSSDHELGTEVQEGRVYTHPNTQISQNGKARMVLSNGNKEIGQRHTLAGGWLTIWSLRCGQVLYVESQLKHPAKLRSQSTAWKKTQIDPGKQMTLWDPLRQINHLKNLKIFTVEFLSHCHLRQQTKKVANSFRSCTELSPRISRRLWKKGVESISQPGVFGDS